MRASALVAALVMLALMTPSSAAIAAPPSRNPFLADSLYPLGHGDAAQQDALAVRGPDDPGSALDDSEIQYAATGPGQFGAYTSGPYPDGRRVIWSNGLDRIVKVDFESFEILATRWVEGAHRWTEEEADASIARFDDSNEGIFSIYAALKAASKLRDLSSVYTVVGSDNVYYIADKSGTITAYGDAARTISTEVTINNLPRMVPMKGYNATIVVNETGPESCSITYSGEARTKWFGRPMKNALTKSMDAGYLRGLEELAHYIETGEQHPRKVETVQADAAMTAA